MKLEPFLTLHVTVNSNRYTLKSKALRLLGKKCEFELGEDRLETKTLNHKCDIINCIEIQNLCSLK